MFEQCRVQPKILVFKMYVIVNKQEFFNNSIYRYLQKCLYKGLCPKLSTNWYHASQMVLHASKIVILGYSFSSADNYFCGMLRENHDSQIIIIDKNMEATSRNMCRCLQLDANRYSKQIKNGNEIRKYNNRVTIVGADLAEVSLEESLQA